MLHSLSKLNLSKHVIYFERALGDNIKIIYRDKTYQMLSYLNESNVGLNVVMRGKYNPFIHEIFLNHPKRKFFNLAYEYLPPYYQGDIGQVRNAELDEIISFETTDRPVFYPLHGDVDVIDSLPKDKPYVVYSASAGADRTAAGEMRSIPFPIATALNEIILNECNRRGYHLFVTGKSYHQAFGREEIKPVGGCINLVDRLSVPGSLEVMQGAKAIITAHSAAVVLAWEERKPCMDILPPSLYKQSIIDGDHSGWGYGFGYPECVGVSYLNVRKNDIVEFFDSL